jgi:hypothetical protein
MKLPRTGQEYANWSVTGGPEDGTYEVKFIKPDSTNTGWLAAENVSETKIRRLVCGPDFTPSGGATQLPLGTIGVLIRLTDSPETVIRTGGSIDVY